MRLSKISTKVFATMFVTATGIIAMACSDSKPATPKAGIEAQIGPGTENGVNTSDKCLLTSEPWSLIGSPRDNTVEDGTPLNGSEVAVDCTVAPDGDGFRVTANAEIRNRQGFGVFGHFTPSGVQNNIGASWTDPTNGTFQQTNCTANFAGGNMGIAKGRVWATITCPHALLLGTQDRICQGTSEFRFENCAQE